MPDSKIVFDDLLTADEIAEVEEKLFQVYTKHAGLFDSIAQYAEEYQRERLEQLAPEERQRAIEKAERRYIERFSNRKAGKKELVIALLKILTELYPEYLEQKGFADLADILDLLDQSKKALEV